jgi:hypothetical protein
VELPEDQEQEAGSQGREASLGRCLPDRFEDWLRIGCGSCAFLPRYAALPRLKTRKFCSFNR